MLSNARNWNPYAYLNKISDNGHLAFVVLFQIEKKCLVDLINNNTMKYANSRFPVDIVAIERKQI